MTAQMVQPARLLMPFGMQSIIEPLKAGKYGGRRRDLTYLGLRRVGELCDAPRAKTSLQRLLIIAPSYRSTEIKGFSRTYRATADKRRSPRTRPAGRAAGVAGRPRPPWSRW